MLFLLLLLFLLSFWVIVYHYHFFFFFKKKKFHTNKFNWKMKKKIQFGRSVQNISSKILRFGDWWHNHAEKERSCNSWYSSIRMQRWKLCSKHKLNWWTYQFFTQIEPINLATSIFSSKYIYIYIFYFLYYRFKHWFIYIYIYTI